MVEEGLSVMPQLVLHEGIVQSVPSAEDQLNFNVNCIANPCNAELILKIHVTFFQPKWHL